MDTAGSVGFLGHVSRDAFNVAAMLTHIRKFGRKFGQEEAYIVTVNKKAFSQ
jgi:hypothetical protein